MAKFQEPGSALCRLGYRMISVHALPVYHNGSVGVPAAGSAGLAARTHLNTFQHIKKANGVYKQTAHSRGFTAAEPVRSRLDGSERKR